MRTTPPHTGRRVTRTLLSLALALPAAVAAIAAAPAAAQAAAAPAAAAKYVGGVAVGGLQPWNPRRAADYQAMRKANVTWLRTDLGWQWIEPRKGQFDWKAFDPVVADAKRSGLRYLAILHAVPGWANNNAGDYALPANRSHMANYCYRTAQHYIPLGVTDYEIGNEVNLPHPGWTKPSAAQYTKYYLLPCVQGLRKATAELGKSVNIMLGGLAPTDWTGGANPVTFLTDVYRNGGKGTFNSLSWHPYTGADHPRTARQMNSDPDRLYAVMTAHGDGAKKIWATEYGQATGGPNSISETAQATLVGQSVDAWYAKKYAGPLFWYSGRDTGTSTSDREQHFGLLRYNGTAKPAYAAVTARMRR
jgi:hypothetical protein